MAVLDPEYRAYLEGAERRRDEFLARIDEQYGPGRDDDEGGGGGGEDLGGQPIDPLEER